MKWQGRRESSNVDDRRKMSGVGKAGVGGGIVGIIILIATFFLSGGEGDSGKLVGDILKQATQSSSSGQAVADEQGDDEIASFIKVCMADNEDVWKEVFSEMGETYIEPTLVLFRGATTSGCGDAQSNIGPFYCPADQKIYIDLSFFEELTAKYGAKKGDFASAYVLAHEVGHHVQNLLGTSTKVHELQQNSSEKKSNKLSVALELQADFYAGLWANRIQKNKNVIEEGDIEEALSTANAIGDDMLQKRAGMEVMPDAFTHGTAAQRMKWFKRGFSSGDIKKGTTFEEEM
ncbi:MAG: neutral zinc metallopeptidase [Bacteroidota bacterium]